MSIKITQDAENRKVFIKLRTIKNDSQEAIRKAFFLIGNDLTRDSRRFIKDPPKTGRIYHLQKTRGGPFVRHQASRRGESPAFFTGNLSKSVNFQVRGSLSMEFGDSAFYAEELEIDRNRPFLIRSINTNERNTRQHFEMELNKNLS